MDIGTLTGHIDLEDMLSERFEHIAHSVKEFAAGFVESLGPVGVAAGVLGTAAIAVGAELFHLGHEATEAAAQLKIIALTTDIAVPALADLKFALDSTGGSVEQLNTVMFMFQKRMEGNSDAMDKGLQKLHLSVEQLNTMTKDQQFLAISEGFRHAGEDVNKAATAMEIFGRQGRTILPQLLQPLSELAEKSKELGRVTEHAAEAAHEFEIKQKTMAAESGRAWMELGLAVAPVTNQISLGYDRMKLAVANVALSVTDLIHGVGESVDSLLALAGSAADADAALKHLGGDIPAVNEGLKGTADGAGLAAKNLDDWRKAVAANAYQVLAAADAEKEFNDEFGTSSAQLSKIKDEMAKHASALEAVVNSLTGETKQLGIEKEAIAQVITSHNLNIQTIARVVEAIDKLKEKGIEISGTMKIWADANRTLKTTMDAFHGPLTQLSLPIPENVPHLLEMGTAFAIAQENIDDLDASVNEFHEGLTIAGDTIETVVIPMFMTLEKGLTGQPGLWDRATSSMLSFSDRLKSGFTSTVNEIPRILERAFTGGGGFSGAVTAIGAKAGYDLGQAISKNMKIGVTTNEVTGKETQSLMGGLLSAGLSGGIAGLVNLGVSKLVNLVSNIGGPSAKELAGRDVVRQFEQQMGGWQGIQSALIKTGMSADDVNAKIQAMWAAEKLGGDAAKASIDSIQASLDAFAKRTTDIKTGVDDIVTAGHEFGHRLPADIRLSIKALMDMKGITDDEKTALQKLLDQGPTFEDVTSRAAKFGITLSGLGSKFQQGNIEGRSKELTDLFTDIETLGGDIGGALSEASQKFSDLVNDSLKYKVAIPENMRPYLLNLAQAGKLVDENGDAIKDLSGLTFEATPLDTSMDKLTKAIQHLSDIFEGIPSKIDKIGDAAGRLPTDPFAGWSTPENPEAPIRAAHGFSGRVSSPTLFMAGEGEVPEDVFIGPAGSKRGGGGNTTVSIGDINVILPAGADVNDPKVLAEGLYKVLRQDTGYMRRAIEDIARKAVA